MSQNELLIPIDTISSEFYLEETKDNKTRCKQPMAYHNYFKTLKMISEPKLVSADRKAF